MGDSPDQVWLAIHYYEKHSDLIDAHILLVNEEETAKADYPMRFYIDEDVTSRLVAPLRRFGHDVIHTDDAGNKSQSDAQQLAYARAQGSVVVTCNL